MRSGSGNGRSGNQGRSGRRPAGGSSSRETIVRDRTGRPAPRQRAQRPDGGYGSDYERDVELYRRIVEGESAGTGARRRGSGNETRQRRSAQDGGAPHPRPRKKTRSEKYRENYYGEGRQPQEHRHAKSSRQRDPKLQREKQLEKSRKQQLKKLKKQKKKKHRGGRIFLTILLVLVILFGGGFLYFDSYAGNLTQVDTSGKDFGINSGVSSHLRRYTDIAILGSDARAGESYKGSRTDAIVIMRIDKLTGDVRLISVLRDSYLKMDDGNGDTTYSKITHAYSYGGGVNTCNALNQGLDLNVTKFITFNWRAVSDTVYCLHGVELNIKDSEVDEMNQYGPSSARNVGREYTEITHSGKQTVDGAQLVTYCRIRKNSGGDTQRARRYKAALNAIFSKAKTADMQELKSLAHSVLPKINTNMSTFNMYIWLIQSWRLNISENISFPKDFYGSILQDGVWYAVPDTLESNVKWLHKKAFDDEDYQVSSECQSQSQEIIDRTGIGGDSGYNYGY